MNVLVLNAGSSSLKYQLIATDLDRIKQNQDERLSSGSVDHLDHDVHAAVSKVLESLSSKTPAVKVEAVGHRVVHGGERFTESALITDEVLQGIKDCVELAPLHNPENINGIEAAGKFFGSDMPQVAVFDTAFHHSLPQYAYLYAIPYDLYKRHRMRRYGFHGTSCRYVAHRYRQLRGLTREETNVIVLHLGNGCSTTAVKGGKSMDTSMGMTPLEGLVMGTRSGDIDPSLSNLIAEKESLTHGEVEALLNTKSGLLGVSGISNDMRDLQCKQQAERRAALAIDVFCYRARKYIGSYLAAVGGADAILFTAGIGEHSPAVRARICDGLQWAGLKIDPERNEAMAGKEGQISTDDSSLAAYCIPTNEELLIARDTVRCILGVPHPA